jgi:hypothetical protein
MTRDICAVRQHCRICGGAELTNVIDLGEQYIASAFVKEKVPTPLLRRYPLQIVRCAAANHCGLVQLRHTIDPGALYVDGYGYRSGTNELMRANLREITAKIESFVGLKSGDLVLDIGCNDGTLLDSYKTTKLDRIGFDPISSIAASAREKGIEVVNDYFNAASFSKVRPNRKARSITSIAMFYDLEDPCKFVGDVASLLADDGVWVIELSYILTMFEKRSYDTICHEHLEYYALRQIEWMLERAGLKVCKVELNDVNGGSFRLFIRKRDASISADDLKVLEAVRNREHDAGLETEAPYAAFRNTAAEERTALQKLLKDLNAAGKRVYAYGASTKGNTILQYCEIDNKTVLKAADRNPEKWGRRTLGTDIPIISEEQARSEKPDYFLVLPWHFFEGFVRREKAFLDSGGKFILPLPEVRIVGREDV